MNTFAVIIETGYKAGSPNHKITPSQPMAQEAAQALYDDLRSGRSDQWPQDTGALVIDVAPNQFMRVRTHLGAKILDRVTMGPVVPQG